MLERLGRPQSSKRRQDYPECLVIASKVAQDRQIWFNMASSMRPRGSHTAQRRLEVAWKLFNNAPEKPKSSNLRPCRCDPEGFSGLRCTRIRPHMRGKEGRGGLRCTVLRPWWRVLRSQTRAPLFFVQLLFRSQGGSREAQDALKKPARTPYTSRGSAKIKLSQVQLQTPKEFQNHP